MDKGYVVVLITAPSKEVAEKISNVLLDQKLVACVNIVSPINSLYTWEGKVNNDEEVLMIVKSRADLFESEIIDAVKSAHPYEVPEIIALPFIMGIQSYLDWIKDVTK